MLLKTKNSCKNTKFIKFIKTVVYGLSSHKRAYFKFYAFQLCLFYSTKHITWFNFIYFNDWGFLCNIYSCHSCSFMPFLWTGLHKLQMTLKYMRIMKCADIFIGCDCVSYCPSNKILRWICLFGLPAIKCNLT